MIISVQFPAKGGGYGGTEYSYYCDLPEVKVGDYLKLSMSKGSKTLMVTAVDVQLEHIPPNMQTLTEYADVAPDNQEVIAFDQPAEPTAPQEGLIVVKQLPIIEQQLKAIGEEIKREAEAALSLAVTEDTVKEIKKIRAAMKKKFELLEAQRKAAKNEVMKPYEAMEAIYKDYITNVFNPADKELAEKISAVEDALKDEKRAKIVAYFNEYAQSKEIDFLTFERAGIQIGLSSSVKGVQTQAQLYLDGISDALKLIETEQYREEILVEYKQSLNAAQAITAVRYRHEAMEKERIRAEEAKRIADERAAAAQRVIEAAQEEPEYITPPVEVQEDVPEIGTYEFMKPWQFPVFYATETQARRVKYKFIAALEEEGITL
jgi:hypothetical protein